MSKQKDSKNTNSNNISADQNIGITSPVISMPVAIIVGALIIIIGFTFGIFVALQITGSEDSLIEMIDDDDSENDGSETFVENDDGEVVETIEVTGELHNLNIDWIPLANQETIAMDSTLEEIYNDEAYALAEEGMTAWKVGTVIDGRYAGWELTHNQAVLEGLGSYSHNTYILQPQDPGHTPVILDRYSTSIGSFMKHAKYSSFRDMLGERGLAEIDGRLSIDAGARILSFEHDDLMTDTDGNDFAFLGLRNREDIDMNTYGQPVATLSNLPALRSDESNRTFVTQQEDGIVMVFDLVPPFWSAPGEVFGDVGVRYDDGANSIDTWIKGAGTGCGFSVLMNVVNIDDIGPLHSVGKFHTNNELVYEPISYESEDNDWYNSWLLSNENGTFEEYSASHPFFYWENQFGDWVQFMNASVTPAAECGKPVIYLYPEVKMDIDIQVEPKGGFSITIPDYNDGWSVTASPDGTLVNKEDGVMYPYLFWEGNGGLYSAPTQNWVMKQGEVETFLKDTLYQLGLNEREIADFMEFWYPRMQKAPYYQIGFHGTRVMDEIAPLSVSGNPETVIRVLMDFQELDHAVKENPPRLAPRPVRDGFTVIEWGGVLVR